MRRYAHTHMEKENVCERVRDAFYKDKNKIVIITTKLYIKTHLKLDQC